MLKNLLVEAGYPKDIGIGEAAINAVIGFLVVFAGILLLVGIVALVGKIMQGTVKGEKAPVKKVAPVPQKPQKAVESDEISEETVAVITAAIMAYYESQGSKCEFRVRRIKKI